MKVATRCAGASRLHRLQRYFAGLVLLLLMSCDGAFGYSVLTHEEIIDLVWTQNIRPILLDRFPELTEDQIRDAHAYAYGGSVIQDLGYYPFGDREFSNLTHYVRSGDFVVQMIAESRDANEYAFALGALSHYASDIAGHPAVNQAVAIAYPKLRAKYGNSVRFAQDKTAHLKTEFGFDTLQVAKNRYASQQYHDFIGFKVSETLLERVFPVVYGMELKDTLGNQTLAVGSYRFFISSLIPQMTRVALKTRKKDLMRETPNLARSKFLYRLSRSDYEREWGKTYTKSGLGTRILALILQCIPKVGPLKGLGFNNPTTLTEDLYIKSVNITTDNYRRFLEEVRGGRLTLSNCDLDSGELTRSDEYSLADESYAQLLARQSADQFKHTTPQLRDNIIAFYSGRPAPIANKKATTNRQTVLSNLEQLKLAHLPPLLLTLPPDSIQ